MKDKIAIMFKHPLISGSVIIFLGSFLANVINFLFNLYLASRLSIIDYGIIASLISLMTLPAYAANAIVPAIVQFGAKYFSENDLSSASMLYVKAAKVIMTVSLIIFIVLFININLISDFFKISDYRLLVITNLIIFISFIVFLHMAMLQAKLAFGNIAFINIVGAFSKFIFGFILVYTGLKAFGASLALLISSLVTLLISFIPLRFLFMKHRVIKEISTRELLSYGIPSAIGFLSLTSLITSDILMVKHFFNQEAAGMYAGISLIGRVIFYFTAPIATVMFPVIVRKNSKNQEYKNTFFLSIALVLAASLSITLFYYLFPDFVILIFIHKMEYLRLSPVLGLFALNITCYSVLSIFVNFYFSIKKPLIFIPLSIAAFSQIIGISLYHRNLTDVINFTLYIQLLLLLILLLYFPYATKKK